MRTGWIPPARRYVARINGVAVDSGRISADMPQSLRRHPDAEVCVEGSHMEFGPGGTLYRTFERCLHGEEM